MNEVIAFRGILFGLFAAGIAGQIFWRHDADVGEGRKHVSGQQRYLPIMNGEPLPTILLSFFIIDAVMVGLREAIRFSMALCCTVFLQISLYYALLLPLLPVLRRYISARACGLLWLIPTYLYLTFNTGMWLPEPYWVIRIPGKAAAVLAGIWFMGFVVVMTRKIMEHLAFRRAVLQDARVVFDPAIRGVWDRVIAEMMIKDPKFQLMTSPYVRTPVTIGLYKRAVRVVLPKKEYTPEELRLIFRHELVHISREDAWTKFFMAFCTALCWFNPLMWMAMRKSAEDIELSCDETVLLSADMQARKQYGTLLLDTAGDARGFSTCLSASAKAMRYRLTNIIRPRRRHSGALVVGMLLLVLCMTSGYMALAYGGMTGAEVIYAGEDPEAFRVQSVIMKSDISREKCRVSDERSLHQYLSELELAEMTGMYSYEEIGTAFYFTMDGPRGRIGVTLYDRFMEVTVYEGEAPRSKVYYIPVGVDRTYVETLLVPE